MTKFKSGAQKNQQRKSQSTDINNKPRVDFMVTYVQNNIVYWRGFNSWFVDPDSLYSLTRYFILSLPNAFLKLHYIAPSYYISACPCRLSCQCRLDSLSVIISSSVSSTWMALFFRLPRKLLYFFKLFT
jgi:hypothetical protein